MTYRYMTCYPILFPIKTKDYIYLNPYIPGQTNSRGKTDSSYLPYFYLDPKPGIWDG